MKVYEVMPGLFVRGQFHKRPNKLQELRELGISAVVCMLQRGDPDLAQAAGIRYYQVPLPDARYVDVAALRKAVTHVEYALGQGSDVLVHCISAHDRSPLVAAVVAAQRLNLSGREALDLLRRVRGHVALRNKAFQQYLLSEEWRSL